MGNVFNRRAILTITLVLAACVTLTSCEPLRKKFTRQKKRKEVLNFVPVLEPEEYPAPEDDPAQNYQHHYSMIKAWYKDLWTLLEEEGLEKKQIYTLNQIFNHIAEMKVVVNSETAEKLQEAADTLNYYRVSLEKPRQQRNISRIQSDLRAFDRKLRDLNANNIEGAFSKG